MNLIRYIRHGCPVLCADVLKWRAFFFEVVFVFPFNTVILYYIVTAAERCYCNRVNIYRYIVQQGTKKKISTVTSSHPLTLCLVVDFPTCTNLLDGLQ